MDKSIIFMALMFLSLVVSTAFASNTIVNSSTTSNSISTSLISNTLQSSALTTNAINTTSAISTFEEVVSPFTPYIDMFVAFIFVIIVAYGISIIYSREFGSEIEAEKRLHLVIQFVISSSLVLFIIPFVSLYITYFPQIIQATASNLISIHSSVPFYILYTNLFISIVISLVGFFLAMREFIAYIKSFQSDNERSSSQRAMILQRFIAISIFMYLSPIVIGVLFILITQIFFSISVSMATNISFGSLESGVKFPFYQTNYYPQCPTGLGVINVGEDIACSMYEFANTLYGVGIEASIFNTIMKIIVSPFGSVSLFMILYSIGILLVMVYSFAKIDWYSLQYLASLKTGEQEAINFNKLKNSYIQYIAFLLSPILFIIAIFVLNAITSVLLSIISTSSLSLIPPLINLAGQPTSENLLLSFSGWIMSFFGLILLIAVIFLAMLKWIGAIIFMFGIFLYFSEDIRKKMFGKRLLEIFAILFLIPAIIILIYSIWFGFIPSYLSTIFGYSTLGTITANVNNYYSTIVNQTAVEIHGSGVNVVVNCVNRKSLDNTILQLGSSPDSRDALGVLLGSCQNFVGYWANGYELIALATLVLLVLSIFGFGTIASFIGGTIGIGGTPEAVKITSGIHGKPLKEKMSVIASNIKSNRKAFVNRLAEAKKSGIGKEVFTKISGNIGKYGKSALALSGKTENLVYNYTTAPIVGTTLGNILDNARKSAKEFVKQSVSGYKSEIATGGNTYISNKEFENYVKENMRQGEKYSTAKKRIRKEFEDKYNAEFDEYGNVKMKTKDYGRLTRDTGRTFKTSNLFNKNIERAKENKNNEISLIEKEYEEKIKKAKNDNEIAKLEKERDGKIAEIEKKYDFNKIAKNEGFKSYKQYEAMKSFADDSVAIADEKTYINNRIGEEREKMKESIAKELNTTDEKKINEVMRKRFNPQIVIENAKKELEEKRKNVFSILKENGADENKLERLIRNSPDEFLSLVSLSFDNLEKTKSLDKSFEAIANAINNSDITIPFMVKTAIGNVGKATKLNFINPITSDLSARIKSTADLIGKMKDYYIVSGISVANQYNEEMKEIKDRIDAISNDANKYKSIILDANAPSEEKEKAKERLESLLKEYNDLTKTKRDLEDKINFIKTNVIMKKLFDKDKMPTIAMLSKLANGDEIGKIETSRQMLENEIRIMNKNLENYEKDLETGKQMLENRDLTDYQKLQIEKEIKELEYKIKNTGDLKAMLEKSASDMKDMVERLNDVEKMKRRMNEIYTKSTLIKETNDAIKEMLYRDKIAKDIFDAIEKPKELNENLMSVVDFKSTIEKFAKDVSEKIEKRDFSSINTDLINNADIENIASMIKNDDAKAKLSDLEKYKDIIEKIKNKETAKVLDIYKNEKIIADLRSEMNDKVMNAINDAINRLTDESQKKALEDLKTKINEDDVFNTEKISAMAEKNEALKKAIEETKLKDVFDNIAYFTELSVSSLASEKIKETSNEISNVLQNVESEIEEKINEIKSDAIAKYGSEEPKDLYFERMLCDNSIQKIFSETERSRFDYKVFKENIRKAIEYVKDRYGLTNDEVNMISNFDISLFNNEKWKQDYDMIMKEVIMPKIDEMKHNVVASYIKRMKEIIDNGNLMIKPEDKMKELDAIETATITTSLALNLNKFENKMKSNKNRKIGMKRAKFKVIQLIKSDDESKNNINEEGNKEDDYYGD